MTLVARVIDGLPLAASMEDETVCFGNSCFAIVIPSSWNSHARLEKRQSDKRLRVYTKLHWDIFHHVCTLSDHEANNSRVEFSCTTREFRCTTRSRVRAQLTARSCESSADCLSCPHDIQERDLGDYKNQAKLLCKRLTESSPARCTIDTGPMCFQYVTASGLQ